MAVVNFSRPELLLKVVYYGPPFAGKTRNLEVVYGKARASKKTEFASIDMEGDRIFFFDYVPLDLPRIHRLSVRVAVYTVPGESCNATRKAAVQGANGIVFVADSQPDRLETNIESLENLAQNLGDHGLDIRTLPLVFQWNKRDLADALPAAELEKELNTLGSPSMEVVAVRGQNVLETLDKIVQMAIEKIRKEYE